MAQAIIGKITVHGSLVAQTPIAVGSTGGGEHVDLEIAIDGQGRSYIPGTSYAGPMRAWLEANVADGQKLCAQIFGHISNPGGSGNSSASRLFIADGIALNAPSRERRHGNAIDDGTGTTKEGFFYTRSLLPQGSAFALDMELDIISQNKDFSESLLRRLLDALCDGKVKFGANKTRGFGTMKLEKFTVNSYDFSDPDDLFRWLNKDNAAKTGSANILDDSAVELIDQASCVITVDWSPDSDIMVKSGSEGSESDMIPLMSGTQKKGVAPVIPGSSLKGVFRSQARKILRTIFSPNAEQSDDMILALDKDLFGSTENAGRLSIDDVYFHPENTGDPALKDGIDPSEWEKGLAQPRDNPERAAIDYLDKITRHVDYVAIDRFTGGASDSALFSARPVKHDLPGKNLWDPIRIVLNLGRPYPDGTDVETSRLVEIALVKLLIADLVKGRIPIGFGGNRGLGFVKVLDTKWTPQPDIDELGIAWLKYTERQGQFPVVIPAAKEA